MLIFTFGIIIQKNYLQIRIDSFSAVEELIFTTSEKKAVHDKYEVALGQAFVARVCSKRLRPLALCEV